MKQRLTGIKLVSVTLIATKSMSHIPFISLQGNMTYKELLKGLFHEDETLQTWSNFTFLNYTHLRFCDESDRTTNQRSGGICLLTDKRLLFLSSQLATGEYMNE